MKSDGQKLGCGWNDDVMARACTGERLPAEQSDALGEHLQGCVECADEVGSFEAMESEIVAAFGDRETSGDVARGLREVERARKALRPRGWGFPRWLIPVTACAAVAVGMVMTEERDPPRTATPAVPAIAEGARGDAQAGLSAEEQRDVEEVLAGIAHGEESEVGAWESFSDESYWDVADELEMQDLEGFEESLDAWLEG